jgi:translin
MTDIFMEIERIDGSLRSLEARLDEAEGLARQLVRACGILITNIHRRQDGTKQELEAARAVAGSLIGMGEANENMKLHSLQEYAEAFIFYATMSEGRVPDSAETGVGDRAYLLGMMDAIGELKREVFESLSKNEVAKARNYANAMQDMYDACAGIRYQEHVLPGFRRKQDVARVLVESCNAELLHFGRV